VPFFTPPTVVPAFPDAPNGPDLPGGSGSTSSSLDGACFSRHLIKEANWRIDTDGIWAAGDNARSAPAECRRKLSSTDTSPATSDLGSLRDGWRSESLSNATSTGRPDAALHPETGIWDPLNRTRVARPLGSRWTLRVVGKAAGLASARINLTAAFARTSSWRAIGLTFGYGVLFKLNNTGPANLQSSRPSTGRCWDLGYSLTERLRGGPDATGSMAPRGAGGDRQQVEVSWPAHLWLTKMWRPHAS
jgi:hypothetical protein